MPPSPPFLPQQAITARAGPPLPLRYTTALHYVEFHEVTFGMCEKESLNSTLLLQYCTTNNLLNYKTNRLHIHNNMKSNYQRTHSYYRRSSGPHNIRHVTSHWRVCGPCALHNAVVPGNFVLKFYTDICKFTFLGEN